jgi:DNA/RNA endonuclease YhcR with UshA esterase domain
MAQAKNYSLHIFSGDKDTTFPYEEATAVSLKELRTNITEYLGLNVVIEGTVVRNSDWTVYVEAYDAVTDRSYGIQVFYGYISGLNTKLAQGNRVRITGTVQEFFGTYQISNLTYKPLRPEDPANTVVLSEGNTPLFTEIDPADFVSKVTIPVTKVDDAGESYEENVVFDSAALLVSSSVSMKNLRVKRVSTTTNTASDDYGAMTLTCEVGGITISVRTVVLFDGNGNLVTADAYLGKTIDVRGILDYFDGTYQIKVFSVNDITIHN